MDKEECYRVLGVSPGSARTEVKRAFRRLALLYSPDRHPNDEAVLARYREIVTAYRTLSEMEDPRRRAIEEAEEKPRVRGFKSFSDVFTAFEDPGDERCAVRVSGKEARLGCERTAEIRRYHPCPKCRGRGGESPCKACGGSGKIWEEVEVHLKIPAKIKDGALLRLRGEGDLRDAGGERGDVYCRVVVE